ncbi:hypothetical protein HHE06_08710 [Helicobacter heilmannii]|uniref:DUF697 domain-containing protein n=2 Tax=Helicobacter heilmannii TaxID=35817 RepID=UPI0006A13B4D|nr:DUF697 domain-containing protein [Helicobacter heilmannii]CRF51012.1 hypothetical protein HHE06_08710 [Helicobacter heilmannii]
MWCKSVLGLKRRIYKKLGLWKWRTIGAAIIGAVPIPFWDLALLAPVQIVMMIHTSKIYGLELSQSVAEQLLAIFADVLSTGHAVCVAVGGILKRITVAGSVLGGTISTTATTGTTALIGRVFVACLDANIKD